MYLPSFICLELLEFFSLNIFIVEAPISNSESHFLRLSRYIGYTKIDLSLGSMFSIYMKDQIEEAFTMFGEDCLNSFTSPAAKHLFDVSDDSCQLDAARSEIFHAVVAKLLFIMKRARPDIETAISFLFLPPFHRPAPSQPLRLATPLTPFTHFCFLLQPDVSH